MNTFSTSLVANETVDSLLDRCTVLQPTVSVVNQTKQLARFVRFNYNF